MLTVACVWVRANVPYTAEYVKRLAAMVRRNLSEPHRIVCLTDQPESMPSWVEPIEIAHLSALPGWWAKLQLFDPAIGLSGRVLYLDLDTLIVGALDPIPDWDSPFALLPDGGSTFQPRTQHRVVKRFNSSVMVFDAPASTNDPLSMLWTLWEPKRSAELWGDQDWIAEVLPHAEVLPAAWFPRLSSIGASGQIPPEARVVLAKKPKPVEAAEQWPWFEAIWRAA